jgi:hypothetical protein
MSVQTDIAKVIADTTSAKSAAQAVVDSLQNTLAALQVTAQLVADPVLAPAATS